MAGVGALFGATSAGLDELGGSAAPGMTLVSNTLKAWGKGGGRVRCFERRAVSSCLLPLLRRRRQAVIQTLMTSNLLALLPGAALER